MKNNALNKIVKTSVVWSVTIKLVQQVFSLAITLYVARILGPKEFGIMAIGMALIVYLNSITSFGMNSSIVNKESINDTHIDALFTFNLFLSICLLIVCNLFNGQIALLLNSPGLVSILPVLSLIIPLSTFYNLPMALLRRQMNFKGHAVIDFCQYSFVSLVMLLLATNGFGIWSLVYAQISGYVIAFFMLLWYSKWRPRLCFRISPLEGLISYGSWEMIRYNVYYFENYASYLIISNGINSTALGLYDRAIAFAMLPDRTIQTPLYAVLFSTFSIIKNDSSRLLHAFKRALTAYGIVMMPIMTGMALVCEDFVALILGNAWVTMVPTLRILCLAGLFRMIRGLFQNLNLCNHNYKKQTAVEIIFMIINIILCFVGVRHGIEGVALAIVITSFISLVVNIRLVILTYNLKLNDIIIPLVPGFTGSVLMAFTVLLIQNTSLISNTFFSLSTQVLVGLLVYFTWQTIGPFDLSRTFISDVLGTKLNLPEEETVK